MIKLWKSKKSPSCVSAAKPSSPTDTKNDGEAQEKVSSTTGTTIPGDRGMSPAQSEDSGLAPDRSTAFTTISLPRENAQAVGLTFLDRPDLSYPPVIGSLNAFGPAADFLAPGDRIHQIDGISTVGLTNNHILSILCHGDGPALIEIEYSLPDYISQNSLCVSSKIAQITIERENGCLGLTLRGGGEYPLIVTNVRPHGPVAKTGRIKPGDRLLRVDSISLIGKSLAEAQHFLKCGHISGFTNLTIEYDVSVMQSIEYSMGPLLIEIERLVNDKLGLVLSNYSTIQHMDNSKLDEVTAAGVYVASILPASIADRCGALSVGDQILSINETVIDNAPYSPDEVMAMLDGGIERGYTQLQVMPSHILARRGFQCGSPKYGYSTLESRTRTRQRKYNVRKSSLPLEATGSQHSNVGLCKSETIQVVLDCSQGSGLILGPSSKCGYIIAQIRPDSVADRSGCIQKGDRLLSVNKLYNLDLTTIRQILGDFNPRGQPIYQGTHWVELEIEFDMADSVIPSSGVFNVKLARTNKNGLGITVNGSNNGTFLISEVKPGSPAHRTGSLRAGDILLAVDSHTLQHYNVDALLKDNPNDYTVLTIKRNSLPDFLFDAQQKSSGIYNVPSSSENLNYGYATKYGDDRYDGKAQSCDPQFPQLRRPFVHKSSEPPCIGNNSYNNVQTQSMTVEASDDQYNDMQLYEMECQQRYASIPPPMEFHTGDQRSFTVRLETNGGPLGITLAGSEDLQKPIIISAIVDEGVAQKSGKLQVGDVVLAINGESIEGKPLSEATKLLQYIENVVDLKISRRNNVMEKSENSPYPPQPQVVYAKVNRPPRNPAFMDRAGSSDYANPNEKREKKNKKILNITLFKDKVYDDYGFSVSDGLYERGVFINRIRTGGPADIVGLLKPFDRIMQVNGTKTQDFDCCLTVPLIAAAGDKIDLIIERSLTD